MVVETGPVPGLGAMLDGLEVVRRLHAELPSTRSSWPVLILETALPVPTTAGMPYSRQTMAVWLMIPPTSVTGSSGASRSGT